MVPRIPTRALSPLLALILVFAGARIVCAKTLVHCEVQEVSQHQRVVTFTWNAQVTSDRAWDACDLIISFRDEDGTEIHRVKERLTVKKGTNAFSGHDLCETTKWNRAVKYVATLDCVF